MKKLISLTLFVAALSLFISCKKKEEDPTPVATTTTTPTPPAVNQSSATAPSLVAGVDTAIFDCTVNYRTEGVYLGFIVTDPQGDSWSITNITSSNTNVATARIVANKDFDWTALSVGTTTLSVTVADATGNANIIYFTLTVTYDDAPTLNPSITTEFDLPVGSELTWNLSDKITDAQGDVWSITNVAVNNATYATVSLGANTKTISVTGLSAGDAVVGITATDANNNSNTYYATVHVIAAAAPIGATQNP